MAVWSEVNQSRVTEFQRFDGEFYKPENELIMDILCQTNKTFPVAKYIVELTDGKHGGVTYTKEGIVFLRNQNIKNGNIDFLDKKYISLNESNESKRAELKPLDIVITTIGTLGEVAIVPENIERCTINQNLVRMSIANINPYYLVIFLMTRFGSRQIIRLASGNVQPIIVYPNLRKIFIYEPDTDDQQEIAELFKRSIKLKSLSHSLYFQAQELLEKELGMDQLVLEKNKSYEATFSEVVGSHRIDAQCYKPDYIDYEKYLRKRGNFDYLRNVLSSSIKGLQAKAVVSGNIEYVSIKDITGLEIYSREKCRQSSKIRVAQTGDLLLAITGATIGKIGIVSRSKEVAFSGDLLSLKTKDNIDPYYLLAVISNRIGQSQCQRWITGSTNGHLSPTDVNKIVIPRLAAHLEKSISELLQASIKACLESEQLLEQTKKRVEDLIEGVIEQ
ncbi:restriction endonuclease subunit S [Pelosinus baikalensis]|uniref:Restriction endonuclease subunit S n=1 Tax=Pelosinus baikalensis TaxID=2892015 RepID=A0ABS8HRG5_9FIRM|nr:restriction endonuclease subunit S [Pelosinus baikalensis]MCC5465769.1 restriction endonuclease subunit S [Pelosinus baikalensis]